MIKKEFYEWMVKYTPQTEWIEGKGILLYLAFFFIELGAALYFVSILFNSKVGMLLGWLICLVLGGGFHFVYLGRPFRVYRAFLKPGTSWISRGMIFVSFFAVLGLVNLVLVWSDSVNLLLFVIMGIVAFLETIYGGFAMSYVAAVPVWNTALVPALYTIASLLGGIGLLVSVNLLSGHEIELMEEWSRILLLGYGFLLTLYVWTMRYRSPGAQTSIDRMLRGDLALTFWIGAIGIGLVYPVIVNAMSLSLGAGHVAPGILVAAIVCEGIGDLSMRYCIFKSALYSPLIPVREV